MNDLPINPHEICSFLMEIYYYKTHTHAVNSVNGRKSKQILGMIFLKHIKMFVIEKLSMPNYM